MTEPADGSGPAVPEDPDQLHDDDRRTLIIGVSAMVGLVLVGLISAQFFGRSACTRLDAFPVEARIAGADVDAVLGAVLGADTAATVRSALAAVEPQVGRPVGAADVTGANELTVTRGGVAAVGPTTTSLSANASRVRATAELGNATVVGSGDPLYQLVLPNQITGQVDAFEPLTTDLDGLTCVDTSVVGSPLAFLLDAGDGELLLYRAEEDGGDPELALRDPVVGRVWRSFITLPTSPPGTVASRLVGTLGDELAVIAYPAVVNATSPAITAVSRQDGEPRWTVDADALFDAVEAEVVADDLAASGITIGSLAPTALAVSTDQVLLGLRSAVTAEGVDAAGTAAVVAIDARDGAVRAVWTPADLFAGDAPDVSEVVSIASTAQGAATLALRTSDGVELVEVEPLPPVGAAAPAVTAGASSSGSLRGLERDERISVAVIGDSLVVMGPDDVVVADLGTEVRDVAITSTGSIVVLLGGPDGAVAIALRA